MVLRSTLFTVSVQGITKNNPKMTKYTKFQEMALVDVKLQFFIASGPNAPPILPQYLTRPLGSPWRQSSQSQYHCPLVLRHNLREKKGLKTCRCSLELYLDGVEEREREEENDEYKGYASHYVIDCSQTRLVHIELWGGKRKGKQWRCDIYGIPPLQDSSKAQRRKEQACIVRLFTSTLLWLEFSWYRLRFCRHF